MTPPAQRAREAAERAHFASIHADRLAHRCFDKPELMTIIGRIRDAANEAGKVISGIHKMSPMEQCRMATTLENLAHTAESKYITLKEVTG